MDDKTLKILKERTKEMNAFVEKCNKNHEIIRKLQEQVAQDIMDGCLLKYKNEWKDQKGYDGISMVMPITSKKDPVYQFLSSYPFGLPGYESGSIVLIDINSEHTRLKISGAYNGRHAYLAFSMYGREPAFAEHVDFIRNTMGTPAFKIAMRALHANTKKRIHDTKMKVEMWRSMLDDYIRLEEICSDILKEQ